MEDMLQNLTRLGMPDVAFLIVNSKKKRSREMFPALDARVSFPVYQETSSEAVWEVLGGGKDDMFVYDRCGRLVGYIPFPLSILDRPFVSDILLYAYHKDACGSAICNDTGSNASLEDTANENYTTTYFMNSTDGENYDQDNRASKTNEVWHSSNGTLESRSNNSFHLQYHFPGNISQSETQNHSAFKSIYDSIWNDSLDESNNIGTNFSTFNIPDSSLERNVENKTICADTDNCNKSTPFHTNDVNEVHDITPQVINTTQTTPKRICLAEDEKVCEQWSKRQLKRIQRCCTQISNVLGEGDNNRDENMCKTFQKKRCKKLKTIIKCCLKVHTSDENEENSNDMQSSEKHGVVDSSEIELHKHLHDKHAGNSLERAP